MNAINPYSGRAVYSEPTMSVRCGMSAFDFDSMVNHDILETIDCSTTFDVADCRFPLPQACRPILDI